MIHQASAAEQDPVDTVGVMVVDDQAPFRRAARALSEATTAFYAVGDAESGPEALRRADQLQPDLVLLDVYMPGMDGFETARRLTESHPECVVVLVSLNPVDLPDVAVTDCGAAALVPKEELGPTFLRGLWLVHGERG